MKLILGFIFLAFVSAVIGHSVNEPPALLLQKQKLLLDRYKIPAKFGNYSHADLKSAPPCGTEMAEFNGIWAYSNGDYQGTGYSCGDWTATGYQYQCVEV